MGKVLRVLVVDDSAYIRKVLSDMLHRSPFIEVVGTARDAEEALARVEELKPDLVTLDLIMPGAGGIGFLEQQMRRKPLPVVIVSIAGETSELVLKALDAGAIDFVQKPSALASEKVLEIADDLIAKVKAAGEVRMKNVVREPAGVPAAPFSGERAPNMDIVLIGISTGGPQALRSMIPRLPENFPIPVAIVMHMPVGYTEMYARRLNEISAIEVREAQEGDVLRPGLALIAPAGRHLTFARTLKGTVVAHLDARPFDMLYRPSVDVMFRSGATAFGSKALGIVMTGMGSDGADGAEAIKAAGGTVYTEAEESCIVYGMPRAVVERKLADRVVTLDHMVDAISEVL